MCGAVFLSPGKVQFQFGFLRDSELHPGESFSRRSDYAGAVPIVIFSIMGMSVNDITSPAFWISAAAEMILVLTSFIIFICLRKKSWKAGKV